jgi:hypothetical protein
MSGETAPSTRSWQKMNRNHNVIARLMIEELPGLVGALQPAGGGARTLSDLARRQHRQNLANAMLAAASGLLMPGVNRDPLGPLQGLGAGLGAALQGYNRGPGQAGILDALGMVAGRGQPGHTARRRAVSNGNPSQKSARTVSAPIAPELEDGEQAASSGRASFAPHRGARRMSGAAHKAGRRGATLRKFSGTIGQRLEDPAVLPGGWQLYGYEKESGRPVYMGPGQELRIYA